MLRNSCSITSDDDASWNTPRAGRLERLPVRPRRMQAEATPLVPIEEGPLTPSPYVNDPSIRVVEGQVRKLQSQIDLLTELLHKKVFRWEVNDGSEGNESLQLENERLGRLLETSESRLVELQEGLVRIQEEARQDFASLQESTNELSEQLKEEQIENAKLNKELTKLAKTNKGLQSYLHTLPSDSEFQELKKRLKRAEMELVTRCGDLSGTQSEAEKLKSEKKALKDTIDALKEKNQDLEIQLETKLEELESHRKARFMAKNLSHEDKETILLERDDLAKENETLKQLLAAEKKRSKKKEDHQQVTIRSLEEDLSKARLELDQVKERLSDETLTNKYLREDLTECKAKAKALERQVQALENEVADKENQPNPITSAQFSKLGKEMAFCLEELKNLTTVAHQLSNGHDPNVSMLLGTRSLNNSTGSSLDTQLMEMKQLRKDVSILREQVSSKYAQSIGDNMTSCITQ